VHKYREGKMQRTLKRELKAFEIVKMEAIIDVIAWEGFGSPRVIQYPLFSVLEVPISGSSGSRRGFWVKPKSPGWAIFWVSRKERVKDDFGFSFPC